MKRNDTRPLTINGNTWEYKIGRNTVAIYDPNGNRFFPKFIDIVKGTNTKLNPAVIINYIQKNLIDVNCGNKCHICNYIKSDVILRVDPFDCEIYGDDTRHFLCNRCVENREEEI